MTAPTVLSLGSLHYDIMVQADHLPRKDETAVGSRWFPKFGGKGGNQAVAVAKAGVPSRMFGAVGDDDFGHYMRAALQAAGVDDAFVATLPGARSGMSVAIVDRQGDYAATIVSGANLLSNPATLKDDALWRDVGLLILQNEVPEALNIAAAAQARTRAIRTVLNAAPARDLSPALTDLVDILIVNAVEAEMMGAGPVSSLQSAADAAGRLAAQFRAVIVTVGSMGLAAAAQGDQAFEIQAEKVQTVSNHGAGDAFIGTLAAALVQGMALPIAAKAASQAAALHVSAKDRAER